ncbi:MAG: hypothetical protein LBH59_08615 [Planctomycetaceae bacterium]|nr:hypothetical protein [Planctomycetaceae bacterium]
MTKRTIYLLNDVYVFWRVFFRVAVSSRKQSTGRRLHNSAVIVCEV